MPLKIACYIFSLLKIFVNQLNYALPILILFLFGQDRGLDKMYTKILCSIVSCNKVIHFIE